MQRSVRAVVLSGSLITLLLFCDIVIAQTTKVNGLITGRNAASMTLQTSSEPKLVVLLTDATQVAQIQADLKAEIDRNAKLKKSLDLLTKQVIDQERVRLLNQAPDKK